MGAIGFAFGIIAFVWAASLRERVKRLERIVESNGLQNLETASLRALLESRKGAEVNLSLYQSGGFGLGGSKCRILDLDEEWVSVLLFPGGKKERYALIRLDNIKNVTEL